LSSVALQEIVFTLEAATPEQSTSTISLRGRNTCSTGGNVSRKNLAAAEEFDEDQLRLFSRHAHIAEMGLSETYQNEDH
jgi:hypothetical protein